MAQAVVLGLVSGGIYGLFALGIVLVYRGSGALNFAQGEIGTLALYLTWWVVEQQGQPWIVGAVPAVALAAAVGVAFERVVVRPMVDASRVAVAVATVGLLSLLLAFEYDRFTATPRVLRGPIEGLGVQVAGVFVSPTQILALVVAAALGLGLGAFLRRTDFGLAVLAASRDPQTVRLVGVRVSRVSAFVWGTGAALGAVAALLVEPTVGVFTPGFGSSNLFLRGMAAAVVGGLTSLPAAFAGGIAVGLIEEVSGHLFIDSAIPGIRTLTVFALVLVVLLLRPEGLLRRRSA